MSPASLGSTEVEERVEEKEPRELADMTAEEIAQVMKEELKGTDIGVYGEEKWSNTFETEDETVTNEQLLREFVAEKKEEWKKAGIRSISIINIDGNVFLVPDTVPIVHLNDP